MSNELINRLTVEMQGIFGWTKLDTVISEERQEVRNAILAFDAATTPADKSIAYKNLLKTYNEIYTTKALELINIKNGNIYDTSQAVLLGKIFDAKRAIAVQWYKLHEGNTPLNLSAVNDAMTSLKDYTLNPDTGRYLDPRPKFGGWGVSRTEKLTAVINYYDVMVLKTDNKDIPKPPALLEGRLKERVAGFVAALAKFFKSFFVPAHKISVQSLGNETTPVKKTNVSVSTSTTTTPPREPTNNSPTASTKNSSFWSYIRGDGQTGDTRKNQKAKTYTGK